MLIFFLLKHSRLPICRHFKVLGRKNHMLFFFRLTSVKCCRLTSYTSTQKSLTPSAEFQSETQIHWKKKICNGSWIPAYRLVKCQRCSQERITAHTTLNLLFVSDFILLSSGQVLACMSGGNWAGACPRRSWIMPSFWKSQRPKAMPFPEQKKSITTANPVTF